MQIFNSIGKVTNVNSTFFLKEESAMTWKWQFRNILTILMEKWSDFPLCGLQQMSLINFSLKDDFTKINSFRGRRAKSERVERVKYHFKCGR